MTLLQYLTLLRLPLQRQLRMHYHHVETPLNLQVFNLQQLQEARIFAPDPCPLSQSQIQKI